jgi:hypothetical protein
MIEAACEGLNITPEQLHQELEEGGDLPGPAAVVLTPQRLQAIAETLAVMRYPNQPSSNGKQEAKRQQVSSMLAQEPGLQYALVDDHENEPDAVILALAIRGKGTCELRIRRDRYDAFAVLELLEQLTGGRRSRTHEE